MDREVKLTIVPIEQIAMALANARLNVQQMLAPFQESFNQAAAVVRAVAEFQENLRRSTQQWMIQNQKAFTQMAEMMTAAAASFERYCQEEEPEACRLLSEAGWLGMDRHFCLQHLRETVMIYKAQGEGAMNDAVLNHFSHDDCALLVAMSERWLSIPYLRDGERIIREVYAHKHGLFALSITALLPLVDGLAAEVLGTPSQKAVALLAEDRRMNDPEVWAQGFCDFVAHVYYKGYEFGKDAAPFLNRHGILHGRVFDYPSASNSTKAFLLLDAIADIWYEKQTALAPATIH